MPRPRERPAAVAAVAPELGRPYSLARLEDRGFSVFAVASPGFWRSRRSVVLGLFANLRQHGVGPAFLVTRQDADCASAATHGIRCVVGQTFGLAEDPYLSMERWSVIEQLLTRRQRVAFVGADVRFIQSAQRLLEASASLDAVFEGRVIPQVTADALHARTQSTQAHSRADAPARGV